MDVFERFVRDLFFVLLVKKHVVVVYADCCALKVGSVLEGYSVNDGLIALNPTLDNDQLLVECCLDASKLESFIQEYGSKEDPLYAVMIGILETFYEKTIMRNFVFKNKAVKYKFVY